ncbi:OmpA family protein [Oecophyllibacter saccharovorans]|nr:OmpA family protein [Oecophyllibacter saccharovorans]QDH15441.1 OmpA family protein [Oecophyllibacter saccharovorans]
MTQRSTIMALLSRSSALLSRGGAAARFSLLAGAGMTGALSGALLLGLSAGTAQAQPVRGFYVGGGAGASFNQAQTVNPHTKLFPRGRDGFDPGIAASGSFGYGLDNGFRVEMEGGYRNNGYGNFHDPGFKNSVSGHQHTYDAMANALFDMDIGANWIYPYFGAGIGYGWQRMRTNINGRGAGYSNYKEHVGGTSGGFAYQGIFGLSFPVPWVIGLSTTMEYRFFTITGHHKHTSIATGGPPPYVGGDGGLVEGHRNTRTDFNHSLFLGLRYEFDPAPPPPKPIPVAAPPAPSPTRTYLVFFDWNSADLTPRAREIVAVAARNSTAVQFSKIMVAGHTDTSGAPGRRGQLYNQALSLKRADTVKAELIRDGVAAGLITVRGYGSSQPLVPTGPDVREPQNRRVEIDLQ